MKKIYAVSIFVAAIVVASGTYCDRIPREDLDLAKFFTTHSGKLTTYKTISNDDICSTLVYINEEDILSVTNQAGIETNHTIDKLREGLWHAVINETGRSEWFQTFAWGEDDTDGFICLKECDCDGGYSFLKFLKCHLTSKKFIPRIDHILKKLAPFLRVNQTIYRCDIR